MTLQLKNIANCSRGRACLPCGWERGIGVTYLVAALTHDRLIPTAHARRYAERIPNARYREVQDGGHAMA